MNGRCHPPLQCADLGRGFPFACCQALGRSLVREGQGSRNLKLIEHLLCTGTFTYVPDVIRTVMKQGRVTVPV